MVSGEIPERGLYRPARETRHCGFFFMPNIENEISESRFLSKADCAKPLLLTISHAEKVNVAKEGEGEDFHWTLFFQGVEKGLIIKPVNYQLITGITGSKNTDDWTGHKIVLYVDPTIAMKGKVVGGLRVRAPKGPAAAAPAPRPVAPPPPPAPSYQEPHTESPDDDGISF